MASCRCKLRRAIPQPAVQRAPPVWIHQHAHPFIKNKPAQRRHSQGEGIRQTDGHPTTAPEPAHFRLWGAWGHPKHCLPMGCLGYSASVDTVATISFSGAGVRNHCGRLGCSEFAVGTVAAIGFCIAGVRTWSMHRFLMAGV